MSSMGVANYFKSVIYKSEDEPTGAIDLCNFKLVLQKLVTNEHWYEFCFVLEWPLIIEVVVGNNHNGSCKHE